VTGEVDTRPVHPLWRPFDPAATLARRQYRVARRQVDVAGVVPSDAGWAADFERMRDLLVATLGVLAVQISHVGSTAVSGLPAKPIIDIDLTVPDSTAEADYLPALEAAGFRLIAREPGWEEHRCLTYARPNTNLHVFSPGAIEPQRHLIFRDRMRRVAADRDAYGAQKLGLAAAGFAPSGDYNGAKAAMVYDIYESAFAADPRFRHSPRPRPGTD
jgi:GrpB-like predicted nucleotidyltransferase (UPF0157 family)